MNPGAVDLLRFIPAPNLEATARNYRQVTTTDTLGDNVNVRVTHNFTPAAGRGGPGGRGGAGGRIGGAGGRGGRGNQQQRTSVTLNAQLQYRRNDNEQNSLFPDARRQQHRVRHHGAARR